MKHWVIVVAYSQTDEIKILFKNCENEEQARTKAKKMHPDAKLWWIDGTIDTIVE